MAAVSYTTVARPNPGGVLFIEVPERVVRALGEWKRAPVRATLNGVRYRTTVAVYGGKYVLPARREIRENAKLEPGGRARVTLEADTAPRTVAVPADPARALSAAGLKGTFDAIAFTHRKEYVAWVTSAKRDETRASRVAKTLAALREKRGPR